MGAVSGVALVSSAIAADIYSPGGVSYAPAPAFVPVATWTGFYLGINGGYGGESSLGFRDNIYPTGSPATPTWLARGVANITGGFGGGQAGYNFQTGNFVFGIETDIQGSDIRGSGAQSAIDTGFGRFANTGLSVDYFGTVRGRIGYALGGTLLYATGGFAYGGVNSSFVYNDTNLTTGRSSNSQTLTGWTAGAGIEYKITPSWSLKGEYQFVDLSSFSSNAYPLTVATYSQRGNANVEFNTVRVGLNYNFSTPYEPLPLK